MEQASLLRTRGPDRFQRGLTPVIALVLIVGIVTVASVGIVVLGSDVLNESERQLEVDQAENAFVQLSSELETTSRSPDTVRSIDLGIAPRGGRVEVVDGGQIDVHVDGGSVLPSGPVDLNAIEYVAADGTRVAYQGGGVWRISGVDATVVRKPDLEVSGQTLNLPIRTIPDGDHPSTDSLTLSSANATSVHTGAIAGGDNLTISVTSTYHGGWARYFESMAGANVSVVAPPPGYDPGRYRTVVATFDVASLTGSPSTATISSSPTDASSSALGPPSTPSSTHTVTASGGPTPIDVPTSFPDAVSVDGQLAIQGSDVTGTVSTADDVVVSSSTMDGDVISGGDVTISSQTWMVEGRIVAAGSVTIEGYTQITGDVVAGGDVVGNDGGRIEGDLVVYGDNHLPGWFSVDGQTVTDPQDHHPHPDDFVREFDDQPLDDDIEAMIETGEDDGESFPTVTGSATFEAGTHYLDAIEVTGGGTVTLDVADGDVDLVVRDDVELHNAPASIHVVNHGSGNVARLWVGGDVLAGVSGGGPFHICPATAGSCDEVATPLQIFGTSEMALSTNQHVFLHGVVYAPGSTFVGDNYGEVYGTVFTGSFEGENNVNFEHDGSIDQEFEQPTDPTAPRYDPGSGGIRGTVTNTTGAPIVNATVAVDGVGTAVTTDGDGEYEIEVSAGTYDVTASAAGYRPETAAVSVAEGETVTLDFELALTDGRVTGTVMDLDGNPIDNATVEVAPVGQAVTTNASGHYVAGVPAGTYTVTASAAGYRSATASTVTVAESEIVSLDFTLAPTAPIVSGTVADTDGDPIENATVELIDEYGGAVTATTDTNGSYLLVSVPGNSTITASAPGYAAQSESLSLAANDDVLVDFELATANPGAVGAGSDGIAYLHVTTHEIAVESG